MKLNSFILVSALVRGLSASVEANERLRDIDRELKWKEQKKCSVKKCKRHFNGCDAEEDFTNVDRGESDTLTVECPFDSSELMFYVYGLDEGDCKADTMKCKKGNGKVDCDIEIGADTTGGGNQGCTAGSVTADLHIFCC